MTQYVENSFAVEVPFEMKDFFEKLGYKPYSCNLITDEAKPFQGNPEVREQRFAMIKRCLENKRPSKQI